MTTEITTSSSLYYKKLWFLDKEILLTSYSRANTRPCLKDPAFTFVHPNSQTSSKLILTSVSAGLAANARPKMDAGSIFLICFVVVFSLILIGGWWFGYPLLMCLARRETSRRRLCQSPQTGMRVAQDERELPRSRGMVRRHVLSS